jgi:hypothetical protein
MIDTAALPPPPALLVLGDHVHAASAAPLPARPRRPPPVAGKALFHGDPLDDLGDGR